VTTCLNLFRPQEAWQAPGTGVQRDKARRSQPRKSGRLVGWPVSEHKFCSRSPNDQRRQPGARASSGDEGEATAEWVRQAS
jgi:hypothetical protein